MAGSAAAFVAALAGLASCAVAAVLQFLWHSELASCVAHPLPFLALYLGVLAWLCLLPRPGSAIRDGEWQGRVASKLESAGRMMVGSIRTQSDQHDVQQALTLLQTIFVSVAEEHRVGDAEVLASRASAQREASEVCKLAELSVSALAAKFETLALHISGSQIFSCRAADAMEEALDCVPEASASTTAAGNADSKATVAFVAILLVFFPIYCAAVSTSVAGGAFLALIASLMPVGLTAKHLRANSAASQSKKREDEAYRRRLFNLRMTELRSMSECSLPNSPTHSDVPTATHQSKMPSENDVKAQRRDLMLKLQSAQQLQNPPNSPNDVVSARNGEKEKWSRVGVAAQLLASAAVEDPDHEVPPYTIIGSAVTGPCVARLVPCSFEKSEKSTFETKAAHESNNGSSTSRTFSKMLGEIGMLDNYAIMQSLGSALSLSTLPANSEQRQESPSVSTFQILSSPSSYIASAASTAPLPEPETPNNQAILRQQHDMPTTPGLTPIHGKRPCGVNINQEPLPDVSQAELSQSTCFSLSPGDTAQNMSAVLASPGNKSLNIPLHLPLQDENRNHNQSPVGFRAQGISNPPNSIQNLSNATVIVPMKRARPRAFC